MTREEIIRRYPISAEVTKLGFKLVETGDRKFMAQCAFHEDKSPSMSIDDVKGVFNCFGCKACGSVIDFWALRRNCTPVEILKEFGPNGDTPRFVAPVRKKQNSEELPTPDAVVPDDNDPIQEKTIEKTYSYENQFGMEVYQVIRFKPKTFRQRHMDDNDKWVWNMKDVERVLYKLPELMKAEQVWICEGEKDVETLMQLGFTATCNVGGAGKWMDSYTETLLDKEIVLCGDNDKAGEDHVALVFESIAGKVRNTRQVSIPKAYKDVSDYVAVLVTPELARASLEALRDAAPVLTKGYHIPLYSMAEMEPRFAKHVRDLLNSEFNLGRWLPTLGREVRGLIPGELVTIVADTGVGKTIALANLAICARPLSTVMFELELPEELLYERFLGAQLRQNYEQIRKTYLSGDMLGVEGLRMMDHIFCCSESRLTLEDIEKHINRAELKIGERPKVALLDYIQLVGGKGSVRRERFSDIAEGLKVLAKSTKTIVIIASQVARKDDGEVEIFLHDPKESGSIENSSGLVLGIWRDPTNSQILYVKILKNTKGRSGAVIPCQFMKNITGGWCPRIVEIAEETESPSQNNQPEL